MKKNKTYLILGASSALGIELIKKTRWDVEDRLVAQCFHSKEALLELGKSIKCKIDIMQADFQDEISTNQLLDNLLGLEIIPTHIAFLQSIPIEYKKFKELQWQDYQEYFNVQLRSAIEILRLFLPAMAREKSGKIVFVLTSCTLNIPPKYLASYVTAKYALLGLMKALSVEYAGKNININAVSPSMLETKFLCNLDARVIEAAARNHPLKRNAAVGDVVPLMQFLLSDEAGYLMGVNIPVAGGECF